MLAFEWDERKNRRNRTKHGIWFEEARRHSKTLAQLWLMTQTIRSTRNDFFCWEQVPPRDYSSSFIV